MRVQSSFSWWSEIEKPEGDYGRWSSRSAHQGHLVQGTEITIFPDLSLFLRPLLISKDYMAENQSAHSSISQWGEISPLWDTGHCLETWIVIMGIWVEARAAAKNSPMHRTALSPNKELSQLKCQPGWGWETLAQSISNQEARGFSPLQLPYRENK